MDFTEIIYKFLETEFINPIKYHEGYRPIMTLTYALILIGLSFFVIYPILHRRGVKFNLKFVLALIPYILFGISLRVIEDMVVSGAVTNTLFERGVVPWELGYYLVSPGIWFLIGGITIFSLLYSRFLSKKFNLDFYKVFAGLGMIFWLPVLAFDLMHFTVLDGFFGIIVLTLAVTGLTYFIVNFLKKEFFKDRLNLLAVGGQALDGSATFVASQFFRCGEQHFLSAAIIGFLPLAFIIVKVLLAIVILYYVDKEIKNENLRGFIKTFIIIMGFATGLRDLFTVAVGTCL